MASSMIELSKYRFIRAQEMLVFSSSQCAQKSLSKK